MATSIERTKSPESSRAAIDPQRSSAWHASAPADLVDAYTKSDEQEGWEAWTDFLAARDRSLRDIASIAGDSPLCWALPQGLLGDETESLVRRLGKPKSFRKRSARRQWADELTAWLDTALISAPTPAHAYECLAWSYALSRLTLCVGEKLWWKLVNYLVGVSHDASLVSADGDPLVWQLFAAELSLSLGCQFPELNACREVGATGLTALTAGFESLDEQGVPEKDVFTQLPMLAAVWTRARVLIDAAADELIPARPDWKRVDHALVLLARLLRSDHTMLLGESSALVDREMWNTWSKLTSDKSARRVARMLSQRNFRPAKRKRGNSTTPAMHSESRRLAVLRPDWSAESPRLAVSYAGRDVQLELSVGSHSLSHGNWQFQIWLDGEPRPIIGAWENVCWFSDEDVDYLEIEAPLAIGMKIQRQFLLARQDHVLLMSDAVISEDRGKIEYRGQLSLDDGWSCKSADETREIRFDAGRSSVLTLPLALPEWTSDRRTGVFEATQSEITLKQTNVGYAAYAPLLFDLKSKRSHRPSTWRQLTVAESRMVQGKDVAAAFRAQVGKEQWLIYRSLAQPGIRSALGQHISAEFLFGRIKSDGGCARLLEIEPT